MTVRLSEPASDWTGQTHERRLLHCTDALYFHGIIDRDDWDRQRALVELRGALERGSTRASPAPSKRGKAASLAIDTLPGLIIGGALAWALWALS